MLLERSLRNRHMADQDKCANNVFSNKLIYSGIHTPYGLQRKPHTDLEVSGITITIIIAASSKTSN